MHRQETIVTHIFYSSRRRRSPTAGQGRSWRQPTIEGCASFSNAAAGAAPRPCPRTSPTWSGRARFSARLATPRGDPLLPPQASFRRTPRATHILANRETTARKLARSRGTGNSRAGTARRDTTTNPREAERNGTRARGTETHADRHRGFTGSYRGRRSSDERAYAIGIRPLLRMMFSLSLSLSQLRVQLRRRQRRWRRERRRSPSFTLLAHYRRAVIDPPSPAGRTNEHAPLSPLPPPPRRHYPRRWPAILARVRRNLFEFRHSCADAEDIRTSQNSWIFEPREDRENFTREDIYTRKKFWSLFLAIEAAHANERTANHSSKKINRALWYTPERYKNSISLRCNLHPRMNKSSMSLWNLLVSSIWLSIVINFTSGCD